MKPAWKVVLLDLDGYPYPVSTPNPIFRLLSLVAGMCVGFFMATIWSFWGMFKFERGNEIQIANETHSDFSSLSDGGSLLGHERAL